MSKYMDWLSSLGDSAVSPANPLKNTSTVNSDGTVTTGGTTTMSGYTIIEADSMEAALSIAKACPFLDIGGSLESLGVVMALAHASAPFSPIITYSASTVR
ncbi:MAG: hypothetical protein ACE1ZF_05535 [Gemmatimonadales bacterium]